MRRRADRHAHSGGIALKKHFGQHFLRDAHVVAQMLAAVQLDRKTSVLEIGCGDGFLTRAILEADVARLWVFEIDTEWASRVRHDTRDARLTIFQEDILRVDFARLAANAPWTVLANLPYQITFPIFHLFEKHAAALREGVVMVQEEVAQKIVSQGGRSFGYLSLSFQHAFEMRLLAKVPASAFLPPPKVVSRLLYFKPRTV
ncbi:MAG: hypothetical protein M1549_01700, partial [Candidatus Dependentiae bacterium]|nr:hypothetical protein [Candidatus Dependentiae bacterium]